PDRGRARPGHPRRRAARARRAHRERRGHLLRRGPRGGVRHRPRQAPDRVVLPQHHHPLLRERGDRGAGASARRRGPRRRSDGRVLGRGAAAPRPPQVRVLLRRQGGFPRGAARRGAPPRPRVGAARGRGAGGDPGAARERAPPGAQPEPGRPRRAGPGRAPSRFRRGSAAGDPAHRRDRRAGGGAARGADRVSAARGSGNPFTASIALVLGVARRRRFRVALIGGFALPFHGVQRTTGDVDFLAEASGADALHEELVAEGARCLHRSPDAANYAPGTSRLSSTDFIYARRERAREMLRRARPALLRGARLRVPVVDAEGLIGLKLPALVNAPSWTQDEAADRAPPAARRGTLKLDVLRDYYRLFDRERDLERLLAETRRRQGEP